MIFNLVGAGGARPTGSITITENGTYDVTDMATANVSVIYGYKSPHGFGEGTFYEAALAGEETITQEWLDPETGKMYNETIPNDNNLLRWDNTAVIG